MKEILKKDLLRIINEEDENFNDFDDSNELDLTPKWKEKLGKVKKSGRLISTPSAIEKGYMAGSPESSGQKNGSEKPEIRTGQQTQVKGFNPIGVVGRTVYDKETNEEVPVLFITDLSVRQWLYRFRTIAKELEEEYGEDLMFKEGNFPVDHIRRYVNTAYKSVFGNKEVDINTGVSFDNPMDEDEKNKRDLFNILRTEIGENSEMVNVYDTLVIPQINIKRAFLNRHEGDMSNFNIHVQSHGYLNFGTKTEDIDSEGNKIPHSDSIQNEPDGISQYIDRLVKKLNNLPTEEKETIHTARQYNLLYRNWPINKNSFESIKRKENEKTRIGLTPKYGLRYLGHEPQDVQMSIFDSFTLNCRIKNKTTGDLCYGTDSDLDFVKLNKTDERIQEEQQKVYSELAAGSTDYYLEIKSTFTIKYGDKLKADPKIGRYMDDQLFTYSLKVPLNSEIFKNISVRFGNKNVETHERPRFIMEVPAVRSAIISILYDMTESIKQIDSSDMLMKVSVPIEGGNQLYEHQINQIIKNVIKEVINK